MSARTITTTESLKWIAELFGEPVEAITQETKREDIPNWDSLGVLTLMADLDEMFEITLSDSQLESIATVGDLLKHLRENGNLSD